jgi:hypothetical protein
MGPLAVFYESINLGSKKGKVNLRHNFHGFSTICAVCGKIHFRKVQAYERFLMSPMLNVLLTTFSTILVIRDDPYLDPGSGSFLIQLLIASLLGAAFVLRTSWSKIKSFFLRTSNESDDEVEEQDENEG